ncbi:MAG: hypothetical protein AAF066_02075 [Pseudomonadota bacterium]
MPSSLLRPGTLPDQERKIHLTQLFRFLRPPLSAGGKALFATVDIAPVIGASVTVGLVILYGALGGVGASMWANATQSVIMFIAMAVLVWVGIGQLGGVSTIMAQLTGIDGYMQLWPTTQFSTPFIGGALFILGWVFAGLSIVGQPHIMTIYMTLESPEKINETRWWYYSFYIALMTLATLAGLIARVMLPDLVNGDPELALSTMARTLLPSVLVGVILAGIFSATLSTIDSLVLSASAALADELPSGATNQSWKRRGLTICISLIALLISLNASQTVFSLVVMSWSTLGSAFGPVLGLLALGRRLPQWSAITVMIAGTAVALLWRMLGWHNDVYEGFAGICVGFMLGFILSNKHN